MEKYEILFSIDAKEDINEIVRYLRETYDLPELAEKYHRELLEKIKDLEIMPNRFEILKMKYINRDNIRKIAYKNYLAFYIVNEEKREVYVLRIRYGKTDWKEI